MNFLFLKQITATKRSPSTIVDIFGGSIAGMAGSLVGQPFDVVKVRLQSSNIQTTIFGAIRATWAEGILAFWRGNRIINLHFFFFVF